MRSLLIKLLLASIIISIRGYSTVQSPNITSLDYNAWWGPIEDIIKQDTSIRPFKVEFKNEVIDDLLYRLKYRRPLTPSFEGSWMDYGMPSYLIEDWLQYWEKAYNFKEREQVINQFPQYKTNVQGLDVHFIWIKPQVSSNVEVVPLLLVNGWPSSFTEFYEVIPQLMIMSEKRGFALEIIAPTIPGFTLSEGAVRPGLGPPQVAVMFRNLMHRLGHKKYYLQGGDFGSMILSSLATLFPDDVLGFHAHMILLLSIPSYAPFIFGALFPEFSTSVYIGNQTRGRTTDDYIKQSAYIYSQATKPDTLGMGLNNSPAGLLAYILERYYFERVLHRPENRGVRIENHIPRDSLMDNIMLYWITKSVSTSMRIYAETLSTTVIAMNLDEIPVTAPTWITEAKYEINFRPTGYLRTKYPNLISYKTLEFGGHFIAYEFPQFFADDVLNAITAFRKWHAIKKMKSEL